MYILHIFSLLIFPSGKEFFVGISERTNLSGARAVAAAFPEYPCTPVKVEYDVSKRKVEQI